MYQYYNENPDPAVYARGKNKVKKKQHCDCVVKALMQAWDIDWREALTHLFNVGVEIGVMPNEDVVWKSFCYQSTKRTPYINGSRSRKHKTLKDFAKETKGDLTKYIVLTRKHIVFVQDGIYRDSWDSGWMAVSSIWEVSKL